MAKTVPVDLAAIEIGRRARRIRRRRGLIEDLAGALGCSVIDLTGQPYLPVNRDTADALTAVPGIQVALHNYRPDDVPDVRPRSLDELVAWAKTADDHRDQSRLSLAGRDVGKLITELQVHALTAGSPARDRAVTALITACGVAGPVVRCSAGNLDLSATAGRHMYELARRYGNLGLIGFARWFWSGDLMFLGARDRARAVVSAGIDELAPVVQLGVEDTLSAEMLGMLHGRLVWIAAQERRGDDARDHVNEAEAIADRVGECAGMGWHFGPTNQDEPDRPRAGDRPEPAVSAPVVGTGLPVQPLRRRGTTFTAREHLTPVPCHCMARRLMTSKDSNGL